MCEKTSASADQPLEDKTPDTESCPNGLELPSHIKFSRDPSNLVPGHALLLLSDSALPLGSFAYSSGLESYLAHAKLRASSANSLSAFLSFLSLSIASTASTSLPYLLAAYRHPEALETIDNDMDAATTCIVAQRASVSQGRALLSVWTRAFRQAYVPDRGSSATETAKQGLGRLFEALQGSDGNADELGARGHLAPLWGAVSLAMGLAVQQATYVFMVNHAKAVLGAAVRASVMGPYRAQSLLASQSLQDMILERIEREWGTSMEQAGQVVPMLDLWLGGMSRIFNS